MLKVVVLGPKGPLKVVPCCWKSNSMWYRLFSHFWPTNPLSLAPHHLVCILDILGMIKSRIPSLPQDNPPLSISISQGRCSNFPLFHVRYMYVSDFKNNIALKGDTSSLSKPTIDIDLKVKSPFNFTSLTLI